MGSWSLSGALRDPGSPPLPNLSGDLYRSVTLSFTVFRWPWGHVHGIFCTKIAHMLRISCRQGPRAAVATVPFLVTCEHMATCLHSCSVHRDAQWLPPRRLHEAGLELSQLVFFRVPWGLRFWLPSTPLPVSCPYQSSNCPMTDRKAVSCGLNLLAKKFGGLAVVPTYPTSPTTPSPVSQPWPCCLRQVPCRRTGL